MSFTNKAIRFSIFFLLISIGYKYYRLYFDENLIRSIEDWANSNKISTDGIKFADFKVEYNKNEWFGLVDKLEKTRYFETLDQQLIKSNEFGFDPDFARELVDYWKSGFNWRTQVDTLNKYKQYRAIINGTTVHFVRHRIEPRKSDAKVAKVMLVDGWPGSFYGFYKLVEHLESREEAIGFDLIIPSLPGYLYSTPLSKPVDTFDTALLLDALMRSLFNDENCTYYVHGEDWGSIVATVLAQLYPKRINGIHVTMVVNAEPTDLYVLYYTVFSYLMPSWIYTSKELENNFHVKNSLTNRVWFLLKESGYLHLQATYPDTIGHALTDSPVGLMAYILEKYSKWTFNYDTHIYGRKDGSLNKFSKDDLLTIITLYWMSNSITSSMRYYKSSFNEFNGPFPKSILTTARVANEVNVGVQFFKNDLFHEGSFFVKLKYENLVRFTIEPDGGHFAAFESPKQTANDLVEFIKQTL